MSAAMAGSVEYQPIKHLPAHVAIIMDGNGRWATDRGMPRTFGHRAGIEAAKRTVEAASALGIGHLTLFGFSSENWARPASEVGELMQLLRFYLRSETADLHRRGIRLGVIGERDRLSPDIRGLIGQAEGLTRHNDGLTLTIALSYGGRHDITQAARQLAARAAAGSLDPAAITDDDLAGNLMTADIPDPDLLIRTSGEQRLSNFLLWQCAYAELVFVDTYWPDFGRDDLERAIGEFQRRERRYGACVGSG